MSGRGPQTLPLTALVSAVCCAGIAACGSASNLMSNSTTTASSPPAATATPAGTATAAGTATPTGAVARRVCGSARTGAVTVLRDQVRLRIADPDPANTECLLSGHDLNLDVVAAADPRAWTEFDTMVVHQVQAYGSGGVHIAGQLPHFQNDLGAGVQASWFPARAELVATNGTQSSGGSYLTIDVTGSGAGAPVGLSVAKAVARATLAVAPRGSSPGPPPS